MLHVFGGDYPTPDGTGVRDYIHVMDLAEGHVAALRKLETGCGLFVCNLGTGQGYSVLEVIRAYEKASGRPIPYVVEGRRSGDVAACWADPTRAREELAGRPAGAGRDVCLLLELAAQQPCGVRNIKKERTCVRSFLCITGERP